MCLTTPTATFHSLARDSSLPVEIQKLAAQQIEKANILNAAITQPPADKYKLSTNHNGFYCTIYSLNNKTFPLLIASEAEPKTTSKVIEKEIKDGKRYAGAIMYPPGDLVQEVSKVYPTKNVAPNQDGTYPEDRVREQVYDNFKKVWIFYKECYDRTSIDGNGMELRAIIHVARGYNNASWNSGSSAMYFGDAGRADGRGWLADPEPPKPKPLKEEPTKEELENYEKIRQKHEIWELAQFGLSNWHCMQSLDVVGHELTHGVVSYTARLGSPQQAKQQEATRLGKKDEAEKHGAARKEALTLNEHIADCFGIMIKHYSEKPKQTAEQGSWDICSNYWSDAAMRIREPHWTESYMRTFRVPENLESQPDNSPKHKRDMYTFTHELDEHENMGILNNAFYRAAMEFWKDTKKPTWENVGKIWYHALIDPALRAPEKQTFIGWGDLTTQHAEKLFSAKGKDIVSRAWHAVGLYD